MADVFTIALKFKNAEGEFIDTTQAIGEAGDGIEPGLRVAYWSNPKQDLPDVETADAQVMVEALPHPNNQDDAYTLRVNSVSRLKNDDGIGILGDVRVEYEILQNGVMS